MNREKLAERLYNEYRLKRYSGLYKPEIFKEFHLWADLSDAERAGWLAVADEVNYIILEPF